MIYDRADGHYLGDYPSDLPPQNGGTHIGIFFTWLLNRNLLNERLVAQFPFELEEVFNREYSGRQFLADRRDGQLAEEDLSDTGNAFALAYYDSDIYFRDYAEILVGDKPSIYHVEDSWENYEKMAERIEARYSAWHQRAPRRWWQLWRS
ncbi:MAG: hypothetical protein OEZ16_00105 [Chromatiales bacterium]|nr:hypothetical protein [Chromatiales bacterium]